MHFNMTLLLLIAFPIILLYLIHTKTKAKKTLLPPGPPRLPLIGNLHQFRAAAAGNLPLYLWKLSHKYGPIIHLKLGSLPVVVVSSAKLAKEVLKTQDLSFCSRPKLLGQQKLSYSGMDVAFSPYGDYWREMRKITSTHLFSLRKIQSFRPIREEEVSRMITKISNSSSSSSSSSAQPVVNLGEVAVALGSSLICRIAFGKRYEDQGSEQRRFTGLLREAQAVMATYFVSDCFPALGWVDKLSGNKDWLNNTYEKLDSFYQELIDEHLEQSRAKERERELEEDFIDILIKLKDEESLSVDLDWHHIKALLMNIFIAATDTLAATIVWTMTALMKKPKIMTKLQKEIRDLVGDKGKVDEEDLSHLPFLKAVVNETFRLHPPAPLLVPRETMSRCNLEGYEIQAKTVVYVNAWAVARDPEYWENPDEFLPERFMDSDVDLKGQHFGFVPFGSGRRMCPGTAMGVVNVELTMANLLYSFDWNMPPGVQTEHLDSDVLPGIAVHKKNPLLLVAKKYVRF